MTLNPDTNLMKIVDEFADFDLLKPKDQHSPHFKTLETISMFIITTQLKGYRLTDIKVESSGDGSIITISGQKPVQDMLMFGGKVVKKDIEMRGFRNSFKVPQGVVLDRINARFNETESELIIGMPKATKRIMGVEIEELKTEEVQAESTRLLKIFTNGELWKQESQETEDDNVKDESDEPKRPRRKFKMCNWAVFGSAFFVSLIVVVFHLVQSEKPVKQQKKRDQD